MWRAAAVALAVCLAAMTFAGCPESGKGSSSSSQTPPRVLPEGWLELDEHFDVELYAGGLVMPVKMDQAPDGRLFVSLLDGDILVIEPDGTQHTFARLQVLRGFEQGLLGIALSPDFAVNGHVFVMACVNDLGHKQQIIRFTDVNNVGQAATVIVDNLPTAAIHNAGGIKFGMDGTLFVSVGDTADPSLSQQNGSLAGRILRFNPDGSAPADNPFGAPDEFEWCRGLRNTFGICVHPTHGTLIGTENGPANNDELNYLAKGKNFEWGASRPLPGGDIGYKMRNWFNVIVPTGVTYHSGKTLPAGYADSLFICSYDEETVLRFEMDGVPPVNIYDEHDFARLAATRNSNKPLDIIEGHDGSLFLSTFTAIWRIYPR
jgi:glucose/arabinose dehydrogenase